VTSLRLLWGLPRWPLAQGRGDLVSSRGRLMGVAQRLMAPAAGWSSTEQYTGELCAGGLYRGEQFTGNCTQGSNAKEHRTMGQGTEGYGIHGGQYSGSPYSRG